MGIQLPEYYTILIARTGQAPLALRIQPRWAISVGAIALSLPLGGVAALVYQNGQLSQRNQALAETAQEVLIELDSLSGEVENLQERAGVTAPGGAAPALPDSQGGVPAAVEPETLLELAQARLPELRSRFTQQVRPALEETLEEEEARRAAFPSAKPMRGEVDVSSEFGLRPNPFGGRSYELHNGIDFRGPIGTPVYATANGVVKTSTYGGGYGNYVVLDHGYGYETLYAHLNQRSVQPGDRVQRGQVIGTLGNTGRSSGPHLHYTIFRRGQAVNPRYYLRFDQDP